MNFIEKIRQKPHAEKVRIIWTVCIIVAVMMIIIWILTSKMRQSLPKDTSLFQTIKNGIKNLK